MVVENLSINNGDGNCPTISSQSDYSGPHK